MNQTKILFISRAYPPITGGIENQNYELSVWLPKIAKVTTIANRKGKKFLPIFLPWVLIQTLFLVPKYDAILLGDGVLSIVGYILKKAYPETPILSIVHGLDITFTSKMYQRFWVKKFLPSLDRLIAVGNETIRTGVAHGIPEEKFIFIPNGVDIHKCFRQDIPRSELNHILGEDIENKKILLTSGRLAKRKGVAWFIYNVIPNLPDNILYIVAGDGIDKENILNAIQETNTSNKVKVLGFISDETRNVLLNTCDIFIQPNIKVPGDIEGFGISVIEASSCKLPVIASKLEGLQDAIQDNMNGYLVEPEDAQAYINKINTLLANDTQRKAFGEKAREYTIDHFQWSIIAQKYLDIIQQHIKK